MSVLTITLGTSSELQVKVPIQGETNWSESFKTEFAQKIVEHDHTGANGKGSKISTAALEDNAVTTLKITDSSVTTAKIADDAVTGAKIADNSITADHIVDGTIIAADVANDAITTDKILDSNVTTAKIADSNVTTAKIADANVTTAKIADANVTASKIGSDVVLSTLNNVSSTSPTAGQVLKWDGSEWAPGTDQAGSGGGSITIIANQTDANSYSPSEGDTLKITADVTFDNVTFNKIKMYVAETNTLTFNRGTIDNCEILGGNVTFKAQPTQTITLKNSKISACDTVAIYQDKTNQDDVVTIIVKNVDIVCKEYSYYMSFSTASAITPSTQRNTTSEMTNLSVNFSNTIPSLPANNSQYATADFTNCRFIGVTEANLQRGYLYVDNSSYAHDPVVGDDSVENGSVDDTNLIMGTDSGGFLVYRGNTLLTSFT